MLNLRILQLNIMNHHFHWFFCKLASFQCHLMVKINIQVLLKDLVYLNFNTSFLLISQLFCSSHFIYFVYNCVISCGIMSVLLLLNPFINFLVFDSKFSIFLTSMIGNNLMLIFMVVKVQKTWRPL